ncbi:MAG: C39 family peptidase [Candidatus Roizmanbacteria bacterium]
MNSLVNNLITKSLSVYHFFFLPSYSGIYFITPKPPYMSQFIDILPSSRNPDILLDSKRDLEIFGAKDAKEFTFWAWRDCGIACVKMILEAKNTGKGKSMMDLTREGIDLGGYILYEKERFVDKGWFHLGLAKLLKKYGVSSTIKKWQSIQSVTNDIFSNKMVILSVTVPRRTSIKEDGSFQGKNNKKPGGHLLLATGVEMDGKKIIGIYAHDPRGLEKYQEDTFIPKKVFDSIFSNRTIVA